MQNQYIKEMLDIPELKIHQILPMSADEIHIEVTPVAHKQCCKNTPQLAAGKFICCTKTFYSIHPDQT